MMSATLVTHSESMYLPESFRRIVPSSSAGKESWAVSEDSTEESTRFRMLADAIELGHKISQSREMCVERYVEGLHKS